MADADVIFVKASSIAETFPERWWVPSPHLLGAIEPGRTQVKLLAIEANPDGQADLWDGGALWLAVEECEAEELGGRLVRSELDRDGYREGDYLSVRRDRVLDVVFFAPDGRPILNEDRARFTLGKRVLVGLTVLDKNDEVVEQTQFAATIAMVDAHRGIQLVLDDQRSYWLPPDARCLYEARPGEYTLRSNGQTVMDPDYVCSWTVQRPDDAGPLPSSGFEQA